MGLEPASSSAAPSLAGFDFWDLWNRHAMALDEISNRMERITSALRGASVPHALVGGQAVALWVSSRNPSATRTTKDVDILLNRGDLGRARAAARTIEMDYFETMGVGMFLERAKPDPRHGVHIVWAGEFIAEGRPLPSPTMEERQTLPPGFDVVTLPALVRMKLMANRDHDRVHLRDLIGVGLVGHEHLAGLPPILADRLDALLNDSPE